MSTKGKQTASQAPEGKKSFPHLKTTFATTNHVNEEDYQWQDGADPDNDCAIMEDNSEAEAERDCADKLPTADLYRRNPILSRITHKPHRFSRAQMRFIEQQYQSSIDTTWEQVAAVYNARFATPVALFKGQRMGSADIEDSGRRTAAEIREAYLSEDAPAFWSEETNWWCD